MTTLEHSFERRPDDAAYDVALAGVRRSLRRRLVRRTLVSIGLALVTLATIAFALTVGDFATPLRDVLAVAGGGGDSVHPAGHHRVPAAAARCSAVLVGAAFGLAGALFQSVPAQPARQPRHHRHHAGRQRRRGGGLLVLGRSSGVPVSAAALVGALVVAALNMLLSWRGGVTGYRFVLCGIALAFMCASRARLPAHAAPTSRTPRPRWCG